jgi:hypothetical protein
MTLELGSGLLLDKAWTKADFASWSHSLFTAQPEAPACHLEASSAIHRRRAGASGWAVNEAA